MAKQVQVQYTLQQLPHFGLTIFRNTQEFEKGLGDCENKAAFSKTWPNFKDLFQALEKELKAIRGPTIQQASYHHANMLANQLQNNMESRITDMLNMLQEVIDTNSVSSQEILEISRESNPISHQSNVITTDTVPLEILRIL